MLKHFEGARLGIFLFLGTILFVIGIFLIGNKESLFVETITIKSYFQSVEGLRKGAPVRLSGLDVGSVRNIKLVEDSTNRVEVTMDIEKELIRFIRLDSEASIETEGLVGTKILLITPGSPQYEVVSDGSVIPGKTPVNISAIIEQTTGIMAYVKDITKDFSEIVQKINSGQGTVGKLVNDDRLYESTVDITLSADSNFNAITRRLTEITDFVTTLGKSVENIIVNVDTSVADIKNLVGRVEQGEGFLGALINDKSATIYPKKNVFAIPGIKSPNLSDATTAFL